MTGAPLPLRVALVVNPFARRGVASRLGDRIARELREAGVEISRIEEAELEECQRQVAIRLKHLDGCILVGGDGLVGALIQLPEVRKKPFAVFPAGSGNDIAVSLGFSRRPKRFVRELLRARHSPVLIDAGVATRGPSKIPHWFASHVSFGLVARVNRRANEYRIRLGALGYTIAMIHELILGGSDSYRLLRPNDESSPDHTTKLLMTVMNTPRIGGGIRLAPHANTVDGKLDLVVVETATRARIFTVLPLLALAKHRRVPEVSFSKETSLTVDGHNIAVFADGDYFGETPVTINVQPSALRVWASPR